MRPRDGRDDRPRRRPRQPRAVPARPDRGAVPAGTRPPGPAHPSPGALATAHWMLIAARALLGVGGAIMMPSTLSLARNMFLDREQRRYAMVVWAAMASVGGAAGPIVGGWIIETFSRQAAFLMNIPVMLLLLVLGPLLLPESRNPDLHRIDIPSVALSFVGLIGVVYSIKTLTGARASVSDSWHRGAGRVARLLVHQGILRRDRRSRSPGGPARPGIVDAGRSPDRGRRGRRRHGGLVLKAAKEAFTGAAMVTGIARAGVMVVAAIWALVTLRGVSANLDLAEEHEHQLH
ncbi:hypothetical protein C6W96_34475 [Streptomyces sp. CS149]|uniref:MFS transporter n=1 Tax=Streptomyces sp. CS149 TaxID=2109332 RepID=UPI000D1B120D|nr:MFS transporter [Streptomyces sp. CS149]PSK68398.1 hypothetical protein C6W96_34475 [Streptomyces sp. CS149]